MLHPPDRSSLLPARPRELDRARLRRGLRLAATSLSLALLATLSACGGDADEAAGGATKRFAYVTNGVDPFWNLCAAGAHAAAKEFGVEVEVIFPLDLVMQKQKIEDLLVRGIDGIAVSPIDGENLDAFLDAAAKRTILITHDSDAPNSKRRCFVGVDNYAAGRQCGELLRSAMPKGGEVALFVGRMEQANARLRRQGVIDALLARTPDAARYDPLDQPVSGDGFTVVATRTDNFDRSQAKANAEDVLVAYPKLAGMAGLFAYNAPACIEALRGAGRLGEVVVVSFDEQMATLDAIAAGHVAGTVSQDPFNYGYHSVRILAALSRGDESVIPAGGTYELAAKTVTAENVAEFRRKVESELAAGAQ